MSKQELPPLPATEQPLAQVFLKRAEDTDHQLWLTHRHLWVLRGTLRERFLLQEVNQLVFRHRMLLFPVILGGVSLAFSLLAIARESLGPFGLLLFFFASFFFFYYGLNGQRVLSVEMGGMVYDVPLKQTHPHHRDFVNFVNRMVLSTQNGRQWWLRVPEAVLDTEELGMLESPEEGWYWMPAPLPGANPPREQAFVRLDLERVQGKFLPVPGEPPGLKFVGRIPPESVMQVRRPYVMVDTDVEGDQSA